MTPEVLNQVQFFELFLVALKEIEENFSDLYLLGDNKTRDLVRGFLIEVYKNFVKTTEKIDSALSFINNSVDYEELIKTTEKLKEFIKSYKEIFIAAGIAEEDELNKKFTLLVEKSEILNKFLTH